MLKLLKSVIKSIGKSIYNDPEIRKLAEKHPRAFRLFKRRLSSNEEFGLYLTIGVVIAAIFIFLFFSLLEDVISSDPIVQADLRILNLLQFLRTPSFSKLMLFTTYLGNWEIIFLGVALICVILALAKKWHYISALLVSVCIGEGFVWVVKNIIQRPRPLLVNALVQAESFSFPSGHAFIALSFYGLLTYFLVKEAKTKLRKALWIIIGTALVLAIGFSRVYLGVHWPSDVLASYAAGLAWLAIIITVFQVKEKFRPTDKISTYLNKKAITILSIIFFLIFIGFTTWYFQTHPLKVPQSFETKIIIPETNITDTLFAILPRTSEDLTGNPIEPINIIVIGNKSQLDNIFTKAGWIKNDPIRARSILLSIKAFIFNTPYPHAPGIPSFWDARPNDFAYEKPTPKNSIRERNHIHFWETPLVTNTGKEIWFATAHFDTSIESNSLFLVHSIDPAVDKERDQVKDDLLKTGEVKHVQEIKVVEPVLGGNGAGRLFFTDGKAEVILLK